MAPAVSTKRFGLIRGEETISAINAGRGTPIPNRAADMGILNGLYQNFFGIAGIKMIQEIIKK